MEVRAGYKQTAAGVIPEDWRLSSMGDEAELLTGFPFQSSGFTKSGVRLLRGSNVKRGAVDWSTEITQHWPAVETKTQAYGLRAGDLVIAMDGALVGRSYATIAASDLPALLVQRVARLRSKKSVQGLLRAWVASEFFVQHVDLVKTHTAIPHISPKDIRQFALVVPSATAEQIAIADALSDVDALFTGLDRLIAKKRDIKKAAMQQLLTGQTRLPGFHGVWGATTLRQAVTTPITDGPHLTPRFLATGVPFLSVNNLVNHRLDFSSLRYISMEDHIEFSKKCRPKRGDILFGKAASVGMVALVETDMELNIWSPLALIRVTGRMHERYVFFALQTLQIARQIKLMTNASSQGNMGMSDIGMLEIPLPSLSEQAAIANVLSDMDAELAALEARRDKTRALKQGMMQELLTGKTRLVKPEAAHV
jgi:type I restriction enzyme S subunit